MYFYVFFEDSTNQAGKVLLGSSERENANRIPAGGQKPFKIGIGDRQRGRVHVGMEIDAPLFLKVGVDDDDDLFLGIIEKAEGRDFAGAKPQILFQAFIRAKAQAVIIEFFGNGLKVHFLEMLGDEKIMMVSFLVAEEEILAVGAFNPLPMNERLLDGEDRKMLMPDIGNAQGGERFIDLLLSFFGHISLLYYL